MAENNPAVPLIEAVYPYQEPDGTVLIEKVRQVGKKFSLRKPNGDGTYIYKGATKDLLIPLYNLPEVIKTQVVYIVEGEKDVETLRTHGLVGTCNFDGAGKWKDSYSKALANKDIVILPDNDPPGAKHADLVSKKLRAYARSLKVVSLPGLKEHGDVTDYLSTNDLQSLVDLIQDAEPIEIEEKAKAEKVPNARYHDYVELFEKVLGNPRRDIFSDDLLFLNELDFWEKARGAVGILRSEAATEEDNFTMRYSRPLVEDHLDKFERTKTPEFLVDVPDWDKQDRIKLFADSLVPTKESPLTPYDFDQLISDWLCKAWQRIYDPNVRNRILILKSPQKKGKDWWTDSLLCGAGQFVKDLSVVKGGDKDSYLQLSSGMFLKVAEFEKLIKIDASVLKDMITKPFTDLRAPHDRATKRRYSRCSFIGSANSDDLLRDHTGSTRFIIFELEKFKFDYPLRSIPDGLQILSQARFLAKNDFKCDAETEAKLEDYLDNRTPEDPSSLIIDSYCDKIYDFLDSTKVEPFVRLEAKKQGWIPNVHLKDLMKEIAEVCECNEWLVRTRLTSRGFNVIKRSGGKTVKGYRLPDSVVSLAPSDDSEIPF